MPDNTRLDIARQQIEFARQYTGALIQDVADDEWFRQPHGMVTHVGWQVAHLAVAEYGLCLFRLRGRREGDADLLPSSFRKQFSKGSQPDPDPARNPAPAEIRQVLERVHAQALQELSGYGEAELEQPVEAPYALYATKLGALFFCALHEMMHAGQLGLLRRALGRSPVR